MLCLRNPWGSEVEWNGAWSDSCHRWSPELEKRLQKKSGADGVFWMSWADFQRIFTDITVCPKQMRKGQAASDHRMAGAKGVVTPHTKTKTSSKAMSRRITTPVDSRLPYPAEPTQETMEEAWTPPPPPLQPPGPSRKAGTGAKDGQGRTCPNGHLLREERVDGKGHICDGCTTWIRPNSKAFACRDCDYDLCQACTTSAAALAQPSAFDPPPRSTPAKPPYSQTQFDWTASATPSVFDPPPRSTPAQPPYSQAQYWSSSAKSHHSQTQKWSAPAMGFHTAGGDNFQTFFH